MSAARARSSRRLWLDVAGRHLQPRAHAGELRVALGVAEHRLVERRVGVGAPALTPQRERERRRPLHRQPVVRRERERAPRPLRHLVVLEVHEREERVAVRDRRRDLGLDGRIAPLPRHGEPVPGFSDAVPGDGELAEDALAARRDRAARHLLRVHPRPRHLAREQHPVDGAQQPVLALRGRGGEAGGGDQRGRGVGPLAAMARELVEPVGELRVGAGRGGDEMPQRDRLVLDALAACRCSAASRAGPMCACTAAASSGGSKMMTGNPRARPARTSPARSAASSAASARSARSASPARASPARPSSAASASAAASARRQPLPSTDAASTSRATSGAHVARLRPTSAISAGGAGSGSSGSAGTVGASATTWPGRPPVCSHRRRAGPSGRPVSARTSACVSGGNGHARVGEALQPGERRAGAGAHDRQDGLRDQAAQREHERGDGLGVGPLGVVEHEHGRLRAQHVEHRIASSRGRAPARRSNWSITPRGTSRSLGSPLTRSTRRRLTPATHCSTRAVLPAAAGASITTTRGHAAARAASSACSSRVRPAKGTAQLSRTPQPLCEPRKVWGNH